MPVITKTVTRTNIASYRLGSLVCQVAESICCNLLSNIKIGKLLVVSNGSVMSFGSENGQMAKITVKDPQFWLRVLLFNTLVAIINRDSEKLMFVMK